MTYKIYVTARTQGGDQSLNRVYLQVVGVKGRRGTGVEAGAIQTPPPGNLPSPTLDSEITAKQHSQARS